MFNNFPKISTQQQQEIESRNKFRLLIDNNLFLVRDEIESDFGVDIILEAIIDNAFMSNYRAYVQLKSVASISYNKDKTISYSVDISNMNYLLNQINSIYVIYFEDKNIFYWDWVSEIKLHCDNKEIDLKSTSAKTITFRFYKKLEKSSFLDIFKIIVQAGNNLRIIHEEKELLELVNRGTYNIDFRLIDLNLKRLFIKNEYEAIIQLLCNNEKTVFDCELVAICYYNLYRYNDGYSYIEEKMLLFNSNNLLTLKACILCESGINERSNIKIKIAKGIFEELVKQKPSYISYYNLANAVSALNDFSNAELLYKKSLELNSDFDMALKNLGTVYYYLNKHDKEIECYNKALEINPYLFEARISKGLTIAKIYSKYDEAIDILEDVDDDNSKLSKKWPHFYYWISAIYLANKNLDKAILNINKYLSCKPDDMYGIYLKVGIYYLLVRNSDDHFKDSLKFLQDIKSYYDNKFEILLEILYLNIKQKNIINCQRTTEELCLIYDIKIKFYIEVFEKINMDEIYMLFLNIYFYNKYRSISVLKEYIMDDFGEYNYDVIDINVLWISFGILFVKSMNKFQHIKANTNSLANYFNFILGTAKNLIEMIIRLICYKYLKSEVEEKVHVMSCLMALMPEIILKEVSRIFGWICGLNGIRNKLADFALQKVGINDDYFNDTMIMTFYKINDELKLFKED